MTLDELYFVSAEKLKLFGKLCKLNIYLGIFKDDSRKRNIE